MNELLKITLLYDFYGELLTNKQRIIFEMHYHDDFSFSEIGEELKISRQAVWDQLNKTEKILFNYENKLSLVAKFEEQKKHIEDIGLEIEKIFVEKLDSNTVMIINRIKKIIELISI